MIFGFFPMSRATLRIAARSASSGTPVKSCSTMRATTNGISSVRAPVGFQFASCFTCSSVTFLPSQLRSTDSSTMRIDTGSRDTLADAGAFQRGQRVELPGGAVGEFEFLERVVEVVAHCDTFGGRAGWLDGAGTRPVPIPLMFIFWPPGAMKSPGTRPSRHGPTYLPSSTVCASFIPMNGGS